MLTSALASDPTRVPSPNDVAKSLEKHFLQYKRGSFVVITSTSFKGETDSFDNLPLITQSISTFLQAQEKAKVLHEVVAHTKSKGAFVQLRRRNETIRLQDILLHLEINPQGKLSRLSQTKATPDDTSISDAPLPLIDGRTHYTREKSMLDYLRSAQPNKVRSEAILDNGIDCIKLSFESDFGMFSITMDKSKNYLPIRITEERRSTHLGPDGRRLSEVPEGEGGPLAEISTDSKAIRVAQTSGRWYVAEFETKCIVRAAKSKKADYKRDYYRLQNVSFTPPSEEMFRPSIPIPDGTSVYVVGEEMIPYEWRNGRVVKAIGKDTLFVPPDTDYRSDRSWFWPTLILAAASLLILACFLFWRWIRGRNKV
jgi:hypothetical protein